MDQASARPCFYAYLNKSVPEITGNGTQYTIICNSTNFNIGNAYSTETGLFTASKAGYYNFHATIATMNFSVNITTSIFSIFILSNGVVSNNFEFSNIMLTTETQGWLTQSGSSLFYLNEGDQAGISLNVSGDQFNMVGVYGNSNPAISPNCIFNGYLTSL